MFHGTLKGRHFHFSIIIFSKADHPDHIIQHTRIILMASSKRYRIRNTTTDLYTGKDGNVLMKEDVIFCKRHHFIITEDGYIDHYTTGAMDNIFHVPDSEFEVLQEKVKSQTLERNRSFIGKMLLSLTGNCKPSKR